MTARSQRPVEIHDLRKSFGRTKALDGLDLTVEYGSIAGFLGPNGALAAVAGWIYRRRDAI